MSNFIKLDLEAFTARSDHRYSESLTKAVVAALPAISEEGPWLAGGALRRLIIGQPQSSDFDFFFRSEEQFEQWCANVNGTRVRDTQHHRQFRVSVDGEDRDIQAIKFRFYESAEEVIDSFDYTITQFVTGGQWLTTSAEALFDLGRSRLAIHRVTYPVATMRRMLKYGRQGFAACQGTMAELLRQTARSPEALAHLDIEYVD